MDRPSRLLLLSTCLALATVVAPAQDGGEPRALGPGGLALAGYDPVAYFEVGGAVATPGKPELRAEVDGAVYRFASAEHQVLFRQDPGRYAPAYGGWCAYAMSQGQQVEVDPLAFRIGEGRLLLFADRRYLDVDGKWVPKEHQLLQAADRHWKQLSGEDPRPAPPGSWRFVNDWNLTGDGLALEGHDPVSYFPEGGGKPQEGRKDLTVRHGGVLYRFASAKHRELFLADPDKYEPRHGGWCSYAMGKAGEKVEVDPEAFRLTDGHLHLFYNGWFNDTREPWDEDTATLKPAADTHWAELQAEDRPGS